MVKWCQLFTNASDSLERTLLGKVGTGEGGNRGRCLVANNGQV